MIGFDRSEETSRINKNYLDMIRASLALTTKDTLRFIQVLRMTIVLKKRRAKNQLTKRTMNRRVGS